jgi:hypothetical protein
MNEFKAVKDFGGGVQKRMDALDYVEYYAFGRLNKHKETTPIPDVVFEIVKQAVIDTRGLGFQTCYIRDDKMRVRVMYVLWESSGRGAGMTMKALCEYIAVQVGDTSPSTVEKYVRRFLKGTNPLQPTFDFGDNDEK